MILFSKKEKTLIPIATFIFSLFSLCSCNESKFLDKPEETNLEFWITEKVDNNQFANCTFLPGLFGGDMYLDSRYEALISEDGGSMAVAPEIHVVYTVTAYPDYSDNESYITKIDITDPNINVYGFTITSSQDDISKTMNKLGFSSGDTNCWSKNNCMFSFDKSSIHISAKVSNNKGIVF